MRHLFPALGLAALLAAPAAAQATAYNVVQMQWQTVLCRNVQAVTAKDAFRQCMASFGVSIPADKAIVTTAPICRSTHRIQPQNGTAARWAYDLRFFVPRPDCP